MKHCLILTITLLLGASACQYPHEVLRGEVLSGYFMAKEQRFLKSGRVVSLEGQEQILRTRLDTLHVYRGDSTILFLPDYKQNYRLGDKKEGIMVLESLTPSGLRSIRIKLGVDYRKHPANNPITLGQVIDGTYDARLDTVQTVYEMTTEAFPR